MKNKDEQYPLFEFIVDEENEESLSLISLVVDPAIEVKGFCFSDVEPEKEIQLFANAEKRIIAGPALIPNKKIKRKDENGNMYMGFFSKETIEKMVEIFNRNIKNKPSGVINDEHSNRMVDADIVGSWIIADSYYDKSKTYGFDLPVGSFFIEVKCNDKKFWNEQVKDGGKFGFSIEGLMRTKLAYFSKDKEEWIKVLSEIGWVVKDDNFIHFLKNL